MELFPPTIIIRHRRENLKKCSLRGLESRADFQFYTYPKDVLPDLTGYVMLDLDAPPLTKDDAGRGLFLVDATWRYAEKMVEQLGPFPKVVRRSIPSTIRTAYPRRQEDCPDPERGLASVEALYVAYSLLGRDADGLLDGYYWKKDFLYENRLIFNKS